MASIQHIHGANLDRHGLGATGDPQMVEWQRIPVSPREEKQSLAGFRLQSGYRPGVRGERVDALQHLCDSCSTDTKVTGECSPTFESACIQECLVVLH